VSHTFPSTQWAEALKQAINKDDLFRQKGKEWTYGGLALVVEADASAGLAKEMAILLALEAGECREALYLDAEKARELAAFAIEGDYAVWKEVLEGKLDSTKALMQLKLTLTKGSLPTLIKHVPAVKQVMVNAGRITSAP
jgi:putative sterol carrier protein